MWGRARGGAAAPSMTRVSSTICRFRVGQSAGRLRRPLRGSAGLVRNFGGGGRARRDACAADHQRAGRSIEDARARARSRGRSSASATAPSPASRRAPDADGRESHTDRPCRYVPARTGSRRRAAASMHSKTSRPARSATSANQRTTSNDSRARDTASRAPGTSMRIAREQPRRPLR